MYKYNNSGKMINLKSFGDTVEKYSYYFGDKSDSIDKGKKKWSAMTIILIILLVALVVGGGIFLYMRSTKKK